VQKRASGVQNIFEKQAQMLRQCFRLFTFFGNLRQRINLPFCDDIGLRMLS
jgi:hypothetical protein